jgi:HEAT repeat protein
LDFAIASDPLLRTAVWIGAAALLASAALLAAILVLRLRLAARLARERRFAERWQPVLAACALGLPESVPALDAADGPLFLALWLRAQESLRGDAQRHLNALAARVGADRLAVGYLATGDPRREMLALVAAGHLRLAGIWPLAEALAAQAPPAIALTAAQALLRIDAPRALPGVLALAARREDWPIARVGAMLRECDVNVAGLALASAIDAERELARTAGLARLLHLLGAFATEAARPAVRAALEQVDDPGVAAAAVGALWHPQDADLARARLQHAHWPVRLAVAKALGRFGTAADRSALEALLRDENWWVRYRAAQALARLPGMDRAALAALRAAEKDRYAADMLGQVLSEAATA